MDNGWRMPEYPRAPWWVIAVRITVLLVSAATFVAVVWWIVS